MLKLTQFTRYLSKFIDFVGPRVQRLLLLDIFVGFFWFIVESSFIFILQGFMASIGLIATNIIFLPAWYPRDFVTNLVILVVFGSLRCVAVMLKNYCVIYTSQVFLCEKRTIILNQALKGKSLISNNEIVSTFSEHITHAGSHVVNATHLIHGLIITILFAFACLKVAPIESLTGFALLGITLVPLKFATRKVSKFGEELIKTWNISYETLLNGLKNIFFLRIHEMVEPEAMKGRKALKDYEQNYRSYAITSSFMLGVPQLAGILVLTTTAWLGINKLGTPASVLISFFYLFIRLAQSASQTYNYASYFKLTAKSFIQVRELLENFKAIEVSKRGFQISHNVPLEIRINDVVVGYNSSRPLTGKINYDLKQGQMFLVKGPSGSGKTTLLKTLLGETIPLEGKIEINGNDVQEISGLAEISGYVGPEPFLIYGTVRENLLYGHKIRSVTDKEIWDTLEEVGLRDVIENLPGRLEAVLLDETQLSSGQKQRLSFARALLRKPKLLILDEATANIDQETEKRIINILVSRKADLLSFVISHKPAFDDMADLKLIFN